MSFARRLMLSTQVDSLIGLDTLVWMQYIVMCRPHRARQQYDLVTAAYVLSELASDGERQQIIQELWGSTKGILVLVEPGTPSGYQYIINAREQVWRM